MAPESHPFTVGGIYEDCAYHPCLCVEIDEDERDLLGISLLAASIVLHRPLRT